MYVGSSQIKLFCAQRNEGICQPHVTAMETQIKHICIYIYEALVLNE